MRRCKPSPTSIIAILALVAALGGTAVAASRYIITSTRQIKPSVLKALRGKVGAAGRAGATGATGAQGTVGASGAIGPQGTVGEKGITGNEGQRGSQGPPGLAVVARARSVGAVMTSSTTNISPTFTSDPLGSGVWTQASQEIDQTVGRVSVTTPPRAECSTPPLEPGPGVALIEIRLDGTVVGSVEASNNSAPETEVLLISWRQGGAPPAFFEGQFPLQSLWLFEPGTDTGHTLTAQVADDCGAGGGNTGAHFTINSVSIDVMGAH
jgi:hypothetical protein